MLLKEYKPKSKTQKRPYYRKVEKILYDYKTLPMAINNLKSELDTYLPSVYSSSFIQVASDDSFSQTSSCERYALLMDKEEVKSLYRRLEEKQRYKDTIDRARFYLTAKEKKLVRLKYDLEKYNSEVAAELFLSKRSFQRLKGNVIDKFAKFLGFI